MWKTMVRRTLILIPQIFILSLLIFFIADFMPGDALSGLIQPDIDPARIEELREMHGLNDPWHIRYVRWIHGISQGDFGLSMQHHVSVLRIVGERLPNTIRLSIFTVILVYATSIPLGIIAGRYNATWKEKIISYYLYFGMSLPTIVFGFILLYFFGFLLGWFPISGSVDVRVLSDGWWAIQVSRIQHMVLPAAAMALLGAVGIVQFLRSEIVDNRNSDYVTTARAKGVPLKVLYNRHILRNSLLPMANGIGFVIVGLLSGTIFIEQVFGYPGMGQLFIQSINSRDFSLANFLIMFYAILTLLGALISDIALMVFDPRIRIK
ncbi:MAG: ABC transporter permease [Defluviitaleaceae bacterium]|nr:ABC transporter permease [Defluviitaleaceae bacterium]